MDAKDELIGRLNLTAEQGEQLQQLKDHGGWAILHDWITAGRDAHDADLKSNRFINDHNGYLASLASYNAYDSILRAVDQFITAGTNARKDIEVIESNPAN